MHFDFTMATNTSMRLPLIFPTQIDRIYAMEQEQGMLKTISAITFY